jgi:hypothetical protein
MLNEGNLHSSRMTTEQAKQFAAEWEVVSHQPNTATGFSGTLFRWKGKEDDPARGLKAGQYVVVPADANLSHRTDPIVSQGWKPQAQACGLWMSLV